MKTAIVIATSLACATTGRADEVAPERIPAGPMRPAITPQPVLPSPEVAKLAKVAAGTYKCKGVQLRSDGSSVPLQATVTIKLELGDAWIESALVEDKTGGLRFVDYRTFDPVAKQWTRIQLASTSGHVLSTSLGEKDGKWTWEGTATSPLGTQQLRDYEQLAKDQIKVWGEALLAGSWQKQYEATCKR